MSNCFAFSFFEPGEDKRKSLALFLTTKSSIDLITRTIKKNVEKYMVPKSVYALTFLSNKDMFVDLEDDASFSKEFDSFVGDSSEKFKPIYINRNGEFFLFKENTPTETLKKSILEAGMLDIFERRKGLITSTPSYHFVKPSGDHCNKFIRASNLLVSADEVFFLALSLLPHINQKTKRIYVDTSSISYLVSVAVYLSEKFVSNPPLIESIESYAIFNQNYDFVEDESSLVVVSATTSGAFVNKLIQKTSFQPWQIVTLFHSCRLPEGQTGLFNISKAISKDTITSQKPFDCTYCQKGSRQIRIVGDQFLPDTPKHELLVIKKTDFQKDRRDFFNQFATKGLLGWNQLSDKNSESKEHFFIDVEKIIGDPPPDFNEILEKKIKKHVSLDVKTIISLDDPGSVKFSNKLKNTLDQNTNNIEWLRLADITKNPLPLGGSSVIVVAAAITSGRTLLDVARKLRSIHKSSSITYLVGFSKLPTTESFNQLKKDLELGGYDLVVLNKCPMPRIKEQTKTAWDWEKQKMREWGENDPLRDQGDSLPAKLLKRLTCLEKTGSDANQLFLFTPNGANLKLRPTFAFWSDLNLDTTSATQADVYWTIQSVIHDLRIRTDEKGLGTSYHTTLISPVCFDRYNDGVIQASLLRAASPTELNYAVDFDFSRRMTDVVRSVIEQWNLEQGEAALEFLIAIWTGRMQLNETHVKEISSLCKEEMPDEMRFILKHLID